MQIGPRIRIGGTLGKIGEKIKDNAGMIGAGIGGLPGMAIGHLIKSRGDLGSIPGNVVGDLKTGLKNAPLVLGGIGLLGGGAGGLGGLLKGASNILGGGGAGGLNLGGLLDAGLGTAGLVNASQLAKKSENFANQANADVRASYDARAPLRTAGIQGMLNPGAGVPLKIANVQANTGVGNPFSKKPAPGVPL